MKTNHINPIAKKIIDQTIPSISIMEWAKRIKSRNISALAQSITLIESSKKEDRLKARQLLKVCITDSKKTIRIGITGPPGVGKSSFIESFGTYILKETNLKIAVLSIDPVSPFQGGSILGDKTRMQHLAVNNRVYIRPTPATIGASGNDLGGIHLRTRESIQLCEYAGYEIIFVETVGIGQSAFSISDVTDFIFLLIPPGGGDELQGIKRGVTELADILIVNKDDSGLQSLAKTTQSQYQQSMQLFPEKKINVMRCSSLESKGIQEIYKRLIELKEASKKSKTWNQKRKSQINRALKNKVENAWMEELVFRRKLKSLKALESKALKYQHNLDELVDRYVRSLKRTIHL